jgi:hypothetical protein
LGGKHIGELGAFTDMLRTATVVARTALVLLRTDSESLMSLPADYPVIAVAIVGELGRRLHSMNRPLPYLTYAANALAHDEYDDALRTELINQQGELANFAWVFAQMASEIRDKQHRHQKMLAAANIQKSILPNPLPHDGAARAADLHAKMRPAPQSRPRNRHGLKRSCSSNFLASETKRELSARMWVTMHAIRKAKPTAMPDWNVHSRRCASAARSRSVMPSLNISSASPRVSTVSPMRYSISGSMPKGMPIAGNLTRPFPARADKEDCGRHSNSTARRSPDRVRRETSDAVR